jgi:hypothetical protein
VENTFIKTGRKGISNSVHPSISQQTRDTFVGCLHNLTDARTRFFRVQSGLIEDFYDGDSKIFGTFFQQPLDPLPGFPDNLRSINKQIIKGRKY